jgi:hypothetical protein
LILGEGDAARGLDLIETQRAVAAGTREDDRDRLVPLIVRERFEEQIDRVVLAPDFAARQQLEHAVGDDHAPVRRNHIDAVLLDLGLVFHLVDGHARCA